MRYLLQECFCDEISARKEYIVESLALWTGIPVHNDGFVHLQSIPANCLDIVFVIGHNRFVEHYLKKASIPEKTVVAITCDIAVDFSSLKLPGNNLYIPHQNEQNFADLLHGNLYGFNFDLTESEIIFYNLRNINSIEQRLETAFTKI